MDGTPQSVTAVLSVEAYEESEAEDPVTICGFRDPKAKSIIRLWRLNDLNNLGGLTEILSESNEGTENEDVFALGRRMVHELE